MFGSRAKQSQIEELHAEVQDLKAKLAKYKSFPEPVTGERVKLAFSVEGQDFYQWQKPDFMPSQRYQQMLAIYEEMRSGIDKDYLEHFVKQSKKVIYAEKKPANAWERLSGLVNEIETRMILAPLEDFMYKRIAVQFFAIDGDLKEDVTQYAPIEQRRKIEFWKRHEKPTAFFFKTPIRDLLGLTEFSEQDLETYLLERKILIETQQVQLSRLYKGS